MLARGRLLLRASLQRVQLASLPHQRRLPPGPPLPLARCGRRLRLRRGLWQPFGPRVVRFAVPLPSLSRSIPPGRRARDAAPARILRVAVRGLRIHAARRHQPSVQRSARDKPGDLRVLVGHIRGTGSPLRGVAEGAVARAHTKPGTLLKPPELREVLHFLNGFVHSSDDLLFHHLRLRRSLHESARRVAESAAIEVPGSP